MVLCKYSHQGFMQHPLPSSLYTTQEMHAPQEFHYSYNQGKKLP